MVVSESDAVSELRHVQDQTSSCVANRLHHGIGVACALMQHSVLGRDAIKGAAAKDREE